MKNLLKLNFAAILIAFFAISCNPVSQPDQASGRDVHVGELAVSDVFTFSNSETDDGGKAFSTDSSFFSKNTVMLSDGTFQTTLTFDSTYAMSDGIIRSGEIVINWALGWKLDSTKSITIKMNDFSRNGDVTNGTLTANLLSLSDKKFQITEDITVNLASTETFKWTGTRTVQWTAGLATPGRLDNVKIINFDRSGTNRNGENFTSTGTDLKIEACQTDSVTRISAGKIIITNITNNNQVTTVEFNGACNDSFTINGVTINP